MANDFRNARGIHVQCRIAQNINFIRNAMTGQLRGRHVWICQNQFYQSLMM